MIVNNPVNLRPFVEQMGRDLNQALEQISAAQAQISEEMSRGLADALTGITAVNGEISNEVSAINQFTAQQLDGLKSDVIQSLDETAKKTQAASNSAEQKINALSSQVSRFSAVKRVHKVYTSRHQVTIPAVNMGKTLVVLNTSVAVSRTAHVDMAVSAYLVDSTTLEIQRSGSTANNSHVAVEVIEYA